MITYNIHAWGCACGYVQDFEPTAENNLLHHGTTSSTCPACKNSELAKLAPGKIEHRHLELQDVADLTAKLVADLTGTDALKGSARRNEIAKQMAELHSNLRNADQIAALRTTFEDRTH